LDLFWRLELFFPEASRVSVSRTLVKTGAAETGGVFSTGEGQEKKIK
jgi:hypothetical protein